MTITTLAIKYSLVNNSRTKRQLKALASSVNCHWNDINTLQYNHCQLNTNKKFSDKYLSEFKLNNISSGKALTLGLHSTTIQEVNKTYVTSLKVANQQITTKNRKINQKNKKAKQENWVNYIPKDPLPYKERLEWRSAANDTYGYVPFKISAIKLNYEESSISYSCRNLHATGKEPKYLDLKFCYHPEKDKRKYKILEIVTGAFVEDNDGNWSVCLIAKVDTNFKHTNLHKKMGIDMGLNNLMTLSNGDTISRPKEIQEKIDKLEKEAAKAQKKGNLKKQRKIEKKIVNIRKDYNHKMTLKLVKKYGILYIGDLKSTGILGDKDRNKKIYDYSFYQIKQFLVYKATRLGSLAYLVNEAYTTQRCSNCGELTGPKGEKGLKIRKWTCSNCGISHDRDQNAARNISSVGRYTFPTSQRLLKKLGKSFSRTSDSATKETAVSNETAPIFSGQQGNPAL